MNKFEHTHINIETHTHWQSDVLQRGETSEGYLYPRLLSWPEGLTNQALDAGHSSFPIGCEIAFKLINWPILGGDFLCCYVGKKTRRNVFVFILKR